MQQDAALKQRKSRLSITAAFDPLHFIDKSLDHAVIPGLCTPIDHTFCIISQSLHKAYQFRNTRSLYSGFPFLQTMFPFQMAQKITKRLSQSADSCGCRITFAELINEHRLVCRSLLDWTNDHKSGISWRRYFLECDRLFSDRFGPIRAKLSHDPLDRPQRTCISLCHHLFI